MKDLDFIKLKKNPLFFGDDCLVVKLLVPSLLDKDCFIKY